MNGRITVVAVSLLMAGCGAGERVTILKAALSQNPSEPQVRAVELFADLVSEGTEGRIRVQIYPNNQLGNQRDVVEGLQMGSVELANISSVMASFVPEITSSSCRSCSMGRDTSTRWLTRGSGRASRRRSSAATSTFWVTSTWASVTS